MTVGSARAVTPSIVVQLVGSEEALASRFALTTVETVVKAVANEVAVTVAATLVTETVWEETETGVVVVTEVTVTTGVV